MWRFAPLFLALGAAGGCGDRRQMPFLGKWSGRFEATAADPPRPLGPWSYRADLIVYVKRFELRLDGPQQGIVVTGPYDIRPGKGITLRANSVKINDFGGTDRRDPNRPYYANEATTAFFSRPMALRLRGPKTLEGVPDRWGEITGRLVLKGDE